MSRQLFSGAFINSAVSVYNVNSASSGCVSAQLSILKYEQSWGLIRPRPVSWFELPAQPWGRACSAVCPCVTGDGRGCLWNGAGRIRVEIRIGDVFLGKWERHLLSLLFSRVLDLAVLS